MGKSKKIKVIFGVNDFVVGGAQRLIVDLFNHFNRQNLQISLITLLQSPEKWEFYEMIPEDIEVHKMNFRKFFDIRELIKLIKILRKLKPDVVISNIFLSNTIFRILKIFLGYKVIIVEHNTYIYKTKGQIFLDKILSLVTAKIVAVSKTVASFTVKQEGINKDKFIVIHNGIDLDKISEAKKSFNKMKILDEIGATESDKIIINVTRLTKQKNPILLVDGFSIFAKKHPNYKLIIIGDGSLKGKLEARIGELRMEGRIFLLGVKKNIYDYYLASDFFVSTSVIEGFGLAHAEAMACGLPLLSTKTAGPDELITAGKNGYFIEEEKPESVAEGMEKMVLADLDAMSKESLKEIKNFSIINTAGSYEKLISDVYGKNRR